MDLSVAMFRSAAEKSCLCPTGWMDTFPRKAASQVGTGRLRKGRGSAIGGFASTCVGIVAEAGR
jgi:hypothetical protein